jgi:hypothetical protein
MRESGMANDDNAADSGGPRSRAAPTIDLKAREVASTPVEPDAGHIEDASGPSQADAPEPDPRPRIADSGKPAPRGGISLRLVGILGALSGLAFFALGSWLGMTYQREQAAEVPAPQPAPQQVAAPAPPDTSAQIVKPLEEGIAGLHRRLDELAAATQDTRARAEQAAAVAENARKSGGDGVGRGDVDALISRLAALERAVTAKSAEPDQKPADTAETDRKIRAAIAAVELRGALERGAPYAAELAAVKGLSGGTGSLAALEPFSASGIPSNAALARELAALAPTMLHADTPEAGGVLDRLQARAARLVHIRPRGDVEGDEPPQIVARAEARTVRGDLAGALAELEKLPPVMRAPAQGFMEKVRQRESALQASRTLSLDSLKAIGKAGL